MLVPADGTVLWKSPDLVRIETKTLLLGETGNTLIVGDKDRVLWQENSSRQGTEVLKADLKKKTTWEERAEGGISIYLMQAAHFDVLWDELKEGFDFTVAPSEEIVGQTMYVLKGKLRKSAVSKEAAQKYASVTGEARVVIGQRDGFVYAVEHKIEMVEKSDPTNPLVQAQGFEFQNVKFNVDIAESQFVYQPKAGVPVTELKPRSREGKIRGKPSKPSEGDESSRESNSKSPAQNTKPNPNPSMSEKDTALLNEVSAPWGAPAKIELLLKEGANINACDKDGWTPLHHAVCNQVRKGELVELLISKGAKVNAKDSGGLTPLHLTGWHGWNNEEAAKALIKNGADLNAKDNEGFTPSHIANTWSAWGVVDVLADAGAELDIYAAARCGKTERVAELLKANPKLLNKPDERGQSPVSWAVVGGHASVVKLLLDKHADTQSEFAENKGNWTLLDVAVMHNKRDVLALLLDQRPKAKSQQLDRLICAAAKAGYADIVELVLENGANINAKDADGNTPLHLSAVHGRKGVVDMLLSKGADVHVKNNTGQSPDQATRHQDISAQIRQHDNAATGH